MDERCDPRAACARRVRHRGATLRSRRRRSLQTASGKRDDDDRRLAHDRQLAFFRLVRRRSAAGCELAARRQGEKTG